MFRRIIIAAAMLVVIGVANGGMPTAAEAWNRYHGYYGPYFYDPTPPRRGYDYPGAPYYPGYGPPYYPGYGPPYTAGVSPHYPYPSYSQYYYNRYRTAYPNSGYNYR